MYNYGLPGSVKVADKTVAHMSEWTLEQSTEVKDGSFFGGDGYKEKRTGVKDWTASCKGQVDFVTDKSQKELLDAYNKGDEVELSLYLNADTYFKGKAFIENISIDNSAEGEYNIDIKLTGNKGVTLTLPTTA